MTYHNRLISTPDYLNTNHSPFWSHFANDIAHKLGENCEHSKNYLNKRVSCYIENGYLACFVSCIKCDQIFLETNEAMLNFIGDYGF